MDDPSLSVFKSLLQARRISFLMTETRQVNFFTRKLISLFQGERDISSRISERVRSYTPLMDIPARQTFPGPNRQTMLHYGVFYDDDNSEVSIKHINSLIYGFGEWISKDNNATGYDIVQNVTSGLDVIKKQSKGQGVVTLHIFFPPHLNTERKLAIKESIHIPESIKPAIFVHQASKSHSLYETVSRMVSRTSIPVSVRKDFWSIKLTTFFAFV